MGRAHWGGLTCQGDGRGAGYHSGIAHPAFRPPGKTDCLVSTLKAVFYLQWVGGLLRPIAEPSLVQWTLILAVHQSSGERTQNRGPWV